MTETGIRRELMRHVYEDIWIGELWNHGDPAGGRVLSEHFFDHRPIDAFPNTKHGHVAMAIDWNQAFPDFRFVIEDVLVEGDKLVARYNSSGTHTGVLSGIPGTGRTVSLSGIDIMRFDAEDRLVEWWHNEDMYGLMRQIAG
ncbi:ester cyclase [Nocardia pseudobrasiliensis]|uniref:Putative ester cyclase n=1 Tax=Nocardia pseudobrasiliensis TaxID=45979 RepID=A0A370HXR9_9NOCA|nr:ester cyclase [Nocardia pseudobrasiliensis]RDI63308.1 putative ester cyclase [Nocardia pseudobrasiliensis]